MAQKLVYISLILLFIITSASVSFNIWLLSQKMPPESKNSSAIQSEIKTQNDPFFDSTIGTTEAEITGIDGNLISFKNNWGTISQFEFSTNSLIVFPDGNTATNSAQLKVGAKGILSARSVNGKPEITSINITP
jgi:hypothetical protein